MNERLNVSGAEQYSHVLALMQPFAGPERIGSKVADHAPVGTRPGAFTPWRHAVQYEPMRDKGFTRSCMDLDAFAMRKGSLTSRVINLGHILLAP